MKEEPDEHVYSKKDIYEAYNLGLSNAIYILENIVGFTPDKQLEMIEELKHFIQKDPPHKGYLL